MRVPLRLRRCRFVDDAYDTLDDVVDIREVALMMSVVEYGDRLSREYGAGKLEVGHNHSRVLARILEKSSI